MALVVETGSGAIDAEAFASVAQADARAAAMGSTWTGDTTAKEQALRRATAYIEQAYGTRWKGTQLKRDQALSWPRYGATAFGYDLGSTTIPAAVVNACIDLAFKAVAGDLNPDLTRAIIRDKVGPLETEYSQSSPEQVRYRSIDQALAPFLKGGGATMLVRA